MVNKFKKQWEIDYYNTLKDVERMWKSLSESDDSKIIFDKIINMEPQFFYNVFTDFLQGFDSLTNTVNTLCTLIQGFLDDIPIYYEMLDVEVVEGIVVNKACFNTDERGKIIDQDVMLEIIDICEKKEIEHINNMYDFNNTIEEFQCFKSMVIQFNTENQKLLHDELYKYIFGEIN